MSEDKNVTFGECHCVTDDKLLYTDTTVRQTPTEDVYRYAVVILNSRKYGANLTCVALNGVCGNNCVASLSDDLKGGRILVISARPSYRDTGGCRSVYRRQRYGDTARAICLTDVA